MTDFRGEIDIETLLGNTAWVTHMAYQLLGDRELADDVVQNVWTIALQRPPRSSGALRAWLKKVLHNQALNELRSRRRRARREHDRGETAPPASAEEVVEQRELHHRLSQHLFDLRASYFNVIYLRFYEDLSTQQIADRLRLSPEAVRMRVSRGLAELREHLDHDDSSATRSWRVVLPALAFGTGFPVTDELTSAVGASSPSRPDPGVGADEVAFPPGEQAEAQSLARPRRTLAQVGMVLLVAAVLGGLWWFGRGNDPNSPSPGPQPFGQAQQVLPPVPVIPDPALEQASSQGAPVLPEPEYPEFVSLQLRDTVTGGGVPDGRVTLITFRFADTVPVEAGTTDPDGRLEVPNSVFQRCALVITAPGYLEHREVFFEREVSNAPYVIELVPVHEASVEVRLPDGSAASNVPVVITASGAVTGSRGTAAEIRTDGNGVAKFEWTHYSMKVGIHVDGYEAVSVAAQSPVVRVVLRPGQQFRGRAVRQSGAPVAGARIQIETREQRRVEVHNFADAEGFFKTPFLSPDEEHMISIWPPRGVAYRYRSKPPTGGEDWDFVLPDETVLAVRAETIYGEPLPCAIIHLAVRKELSDELDEGFVTRMVPTPRERIHSRYTCAAIVTAGVDENGEAVFEPFTLSDEPVFLAAFHDGSYCFYGEVPVDVAEPKVTVRIPDGPSTTFRVSDAAGQPRASFALRFKEIWSDGTEFEWPMQHTGADGALVLRNLPRTGDLVPRWRGPAGEPVHVTDLVVRSHLATQPLTSLNGSEDYHLVQARSFAVPESTTIELEADESLGATYLSLFFEDTDGRPVRAWTEVIMDARDRPGRKTAVGQNQRRGSSWVDHCLLLSKRFNGVLAFRPEGYAWTWVELRSFPVSRQLFVEVAPAQRVDLSFVSAEDRPCGNRAIYVALPPEDPTFCVLLGQTDDAGTLTAEVLSPGAYTFWTPRSSNGITLETPDWVELDQEQAELDLLGHGALSKQTTRVRIEATREEPR